MLAPPRSKNIHKVKMPARSGRGFVLPMPEPDSDESKEEEETEVTVEEPTPLPDILAALRAKTGKTFATFTTYVIVIVFVRSFVLTISPSRVAQGETNGT